MRIISESERLRMRAFTAAMLGTLTLSSATPSPVKIAAPFGSPATPPHTPTHLPAFEIDYNRFVKDLSFILQNLSFADLSKRDQSTSIKDL